MKDKNKNFFIYYIIPLIIFVLLFIYINNQINISISYKKISTINKNIAEANNFHKKLLIEYYSNMDFKNIEKLAREKGFIIKSKFKDYRLVDTNEKK